jgi:hypothetical protein
MNKTFHRFSAADTVEKSKQQNSRDSRHRIMFILRSKASFRPLQVGIISSRPHSNLPQATQSNVVYA